jgi:hypothetical protein
MVRPIVDSRGNVISGEQVAERTNIIGARNFRGGLPDADANLSFVPMDRRGVAGLQGKFQEMMQTHVGIAAAVYWAITEGAALPKEVVWPHRDKPDADAEAFMRLCESAVLDDAVVYDGMIEGQAALWAYPLLDAFMGFGLMLPRMIGDGAVEWYPVAHNAVMLWKPNGYLLGGVRFSTPNGYDDIDALDLVHTVHGFAGSGEFEGRSLLRDCVQPFELWKQIAVNAGVYNQMSWGFLDIAYQPNASDDDVAAFNTFAQQFQDGQRKYILRPQAVEVDMKYPSGSPPDVIAQLEYWDRQIEKKLNAPLAGISQFGSRAMAETLDEAGGRKAKAWLNSVFDRASRGMFQWLAQAVGYDGKLPRVQVQAAEMTTGIGGWTAYVQGVQSGLLTKGPEDEAWGRRVIGAPELADEPKMTAETPTPLQVANVQAVQALLSALKPSQMAPVPLAPDAVVLLLQSAGVSEANARAMVAAQLAVPDATPATTEDPSAVRAEVAPTDALPAAPAEVGTPAPAGQPQVVVGGNIEVPAAIVEAAAFAPVKPAGDMADLADEVDTTPTTEMATVAERALGWRDEHGRGGTAVGVARARDIKNRKALSEQTVRRMASYFARHKVDKQGKGFDKGGEGFPSAGRIAWDLWGGDAGADWSARKVDEFDRLAGDLAESALLLSAALAEHPDVVVPDGVKSAAAAALEAHRASKSKTSDSSALVYARDLAAGKRLAWGRVMRLAEYFLKQHPQHVGTKAYLAQGPSWHAYQLRGGDAARAWVRSLLTAYASGAHSRAARLAAMGSSKGGDLGDDEGEGVLVVGADGREFVTYRTLRPEEEVVAWVTLAEGRRDLDVELSVELERIADRHRQAVIDGLADGWQSGERDRIWQQYVGEYQAALTAAAGKLRADVGSQVLDEARRAARGGAIATISIDNVAAGQAALAATASDQFARAAAMTQKAGEVMADRVQGEVENAILGGVALDTWESRITPLGLVSSSLESRNTVEGAARVAEYANTPAALGLMPTKAIRSSVPDGKRCAHCKALDGTEVDLVGADGEPLDDLELPPLPDPDCAGGVSRCRCGWFVIYGKID